MERDPGKHPRRFPPGGVEIVRQVLDELAPHRVVALARLLEVDVGPDEDRDASRGCGKQRERVPRPGRISPAECIEKPEVQLARRRPKTFGHRAVDQNEDRAIGIVGADRAEKFLRIRRREKIGSQAKDRRPDRSSRI